MVLLNSDDSAILAMIAQYDKVPASQKETLVKRLSKNARPVGWILMGKKPAKASREAIKTAEQFQKWTLQNKKSSGAARSRRSAQRSGVRIASQVPDVQPVTVRIA